MSQIVRLVNVSESRESRRWRNVEPLRKFPRIKRAFRWVVFCMRERECHPGRKKTNGSKLPDGPDEIKKEQEFEPFGSELRGGVLIG